MEALVAVGLAGNVVQFVQFFGQLVSLANEIKRKGAPSSLLDLRKVAQDLAQQTRVIVTRLKANAATLEHEEQHLLDVATDCEKAGEEFIAYIDDLIKTSKPSSRLGSFQSSAKIKWQHSKIEAYVSRLDRLQGSLLLATMLSMRTRETESHQEILQHLRSIEAENHVSQQSDNRLIRAVSLLQDVVQQQSGPKLDMLQNQMDSCMENIQDIRSTFTNTREKEILRWLDFRQRTWRFEEVEEAHQTTFEWIFREPCTNTLWHDFGSYLSGSTISSPYFINGKAGSGKSTLMKFIISHPETKKRLEKWAGQHKLFSPHFFFWNIGTQLQKSHTGLLRSLLHSVLIQYPDLVPAVFPTLYTNGLPVSDDENPSYIELKSAFERMKTRSASFLRICIFIDGVDEFDGDHRDMSMFLCSLASSTIKVVVSSRPINACLNVFRDCPTLRLQDLTHGDMRVFIQDKLSSHPMMAELEYESPEKAATLKTEIQQKAEGVFLWVRLVTALLLRGLEDGDDLDDLIPKLRALPNDLRELYARMMQKMPSDYQVQASQMFQIFEWWRISGLDEPLELLLFSFAIQQPYIALDSSPHILNTQKKEHYLERIVYRVRSRCCGLLEIRSHPTSSIFWPPTPVVAYLHRSVAEFLADPDVWKHILSLTNNTTFSPGTHIACGILSILKTSRPPLGDSSLRKPRISSRTKYSERILDLAMFVCCRNADMEDAIILGYMDAIDDIMSPVAQGLRPAHFGRKGLPNSEHWSIQMAPSCLGQEARYTSLRRLPSIQASIRTFAAHNGIISYLKAVDRNSELTDVATLIVFALGSWVHRGVRFPGQQETLEFLLQILNQRSELKLETLIGGKTLWQCAVSVAYDLSSALYNGQIKLSDGHTARYMKARQEAFRLTLHKCDMNTPIRALEENGAIAARDEEREEKLQGQPVANFGTTLARNEQQTCEDVAGWLQEYEDPFSEAQKRRFYTQEPTDDAILDAFETLKSSPDVKETVDILQMFLSTTDKRTELLDISSPERPITKAFTILRVALQQAHRGEMMWASEPEYEYLHQLVGLEFPR